MTAFRVFKRADNKIHVQAMSQWRIGPLPHTINYAAEKLKRIHESKKVNTRLRHNLLEEMNKLAVQ